MKKDVMNRTERQNGYNLYEIDDKGNATFYMSFEREHSAFKALLTIMDTALGATLDGEPASSFKRVRFALYKRPLQTVRTLVNHCGIKESVIETGTMLLRTPKLKVLDLPF